MNVPQYIWILIAAVLVLVAFGLAIDIVDLNGK